MLRLALGFAAAVAFVLGGGFAFIPRCLRLRLANADDSADPAVDP